MNLPKYELLTEEVVESAERRAQVPEIANSQGEYLPETMINILQDIRHELRDLNANVEVARAETANALTRIRNRFIFRGQISTVQKTVPGSGLILARAQAPDQATLNAINVFANNNPALAAADVGSSPAFFNAAIDNYQHIDCLKLIYFYNEGMGIVAGNDLPERKNAVRNWLNTF